VVTCMLTYVINTSYSFHLFFVFPAEEQKRYQIFKNNMKMASQIQQYDLGTATYGASPFADLTGSVLVVVFV